MFNFKQNENKKIKPNLWKLFSIPESNSNDFFSKTEIIFKEKETEFTNRIKKIRFSELIKFHTYTLKIEKTDVSPR